MPEPGNISIPLHNTKGYMGGAIAAHVRIGEAPIPQVVIAVLLWIGYCMSRPDVFNAAFGIASKQRDT